MMRRFGWIAVLALCLMACADTSGDAGSTTVTTGTSTTTPATMATSTTVATSTVPEGPTEIAFLDTGGVGGSGQTVSPRRLTEGRAFSFVEFEPPFVATPPSEHWAVGLHTSSVVLFEWTGDNGQRPGSIYVMLFDSSTGSVDEAWSRLEATITNSLDGLGTTMEWIDRGSGPVGDITADWRELRTLPEVTRPMGWPCVISLPGGCVWTDATARFYVVPLGSITTTIAVYENRCDCVVGASYTKFAGGANELHDWTELFEELLRSVEFQT